MGALAYSVLGFLIAIAVLVTVHEFGHFWVARRCGVTVLKFSIGFGKSLFHWRRQNDPTEYSIGMIPLGGYVKMLDEREGTVDEADRDKAFNRQSLGARTAIVAAGPVFNFLFAILAIWLVFVAGSDDMAPVVGQVVPQSMAEQAGISPGDTLVRVDERRVKTWGQYQLYLLHQAMQGNKVAIELVDEDQQYRTVTLDFALLDQAQVSTRSITSQIGIWPPAPPAEVQRIVENSPASQAGLMPGDGIIAIDGQPISDWSALVQAVASRPGERLLLTVNRQGERLDIPLKTATVTVEGQQYGQIGLYRPGLEVTRLQYGPLDAFWYSIEYNWRMTVVTLRSLGRMLTAKMSSDNLSGPITIARIAGQTVTTGYADFLRFLAIISISLGLLNLLPIPLLDGGHLLYFAIEAVTGRAPSEKFMMWGHQLGILILVLLMTLAFYNDIMRLL